MNNNQNIKKEGPQNMQQKQPKRRFRRYSWNILNFVMLWLFGLFYFSLYIWARGVNVSDVLSQVLMILGLWDYFCVINAIFTEYMVYFLHEVSNFWSLISYKYRIWDTVMRYKCRLCGDVFLYYLEYALDNLFDSFEQLMEFIKKLIQK